MRSENEPSTPSPVPSSPPEESRVPRRWGTMDVLKAEENREVVRTLLRYSAIMMILPIATYFLMEKVLLKDMTTKTRTLWSGLSAVLAVNIVIALYVRVALLESAEEAGESSQRRPNRYTPKTD